MGHEVARPDPPTPIPVKTIAPNFEPIINLNCAFYEKCTLPKKSFLCNKFPEFTICPEYQANRIKLIH